MNRTVTFFLAAALAVPTAVSGQDATQAEVTQAEVTQPEATEPAAAATTEPASTSEGTVTGQGRGRYDNVDLVDFGRFRMADRRGYRNLVTVGWLFPIGATVRYDRLLIDNISVLGQVGFGSFKFGDTTWTSWRVGGGMNWHPVGNGMHGFFLGPRVQYTNYTLSVEDDLGEAKGTVSSLVASGLAGWRWIWNPGFSLSLGLGAAYRATVAEAEAEYDDGTEATGVDSERASGFGFDMEFTLGWAF